MCEVLINYRKHEENNKFAEIHNGAPREIFLNHKLKLRSK
jgi:hypothetical protein